jgi:hypothetical protein
VFYGLQFEHVELVANVTFSQRFTRSPSVSPSSEVNRIGFALGIYKRDPAGIGVQLAYVSDVERFLTGAIQLQVGLFFDVL